MPSEPRLLSIGDLFPPEGHRYFTDERIEELSQQALPGDDVTLPALTVIELICDWRNMAVRLGELVPADRGEVSDDAEGSGTDASN